MVVGIKFFGKFIQLQRLRRRLSEQALNEADALPRRLATKLLGHQRRCDAADEDLVCVTVRHLQGEFDALRDARELEREQGRDVDAVPRRSEDRRGPRP